MILSQYTPIRPFFDSQLRDFQVKMFGQLFRKLREVLVEGSYVSVSRLSESNAFH